jgi:hypothetical protein
MAWDRTARKQIYYDARVSEAAQGKWEAYARVGRRFKSLGCFATKREAKHVAEAHYGIPR